MTQIDLSIFDKEEDLSLLLGVLKEEYFYQKIRNASSEVGKLSKEEFNTIADALVEEFFKFAEESEDADVKGDYSFSLSGYDINTWMDYWFGISESGVTLKENGVFFSISEESIKNIEARISTLSQRFGYEVEPSQRSENVMVFGKKTRNTPEDLKVDVPKFTLKGEPFEDINSFAQDIKSLEGSNDKATLGNFVKKYKDLFYKNFNIDPKGLSDKIPEPDKKAYKTEIIGLLKDHITKLKSELELPEGESGKSVGFMSLGSEPAAGQGVAGFQAEKDIKLDLRKETERKLEAPGGIEERVQGLQKELYDLQGKQNQLNEGIKNQTIDPESNETKLQLLDLDKLVSEKTKELGDVQVAKGKIVPYRTQRLTKIQDEIIKKKEAIDRDTSILEKLQSTGSALTEEDLKSSEVYDYILKRLGNTDKNVYKEFLFPSEGDITFSKYLYEAMKGNIETMPDDYFGEFKKKIDDLSTKRLEFNVSERESSKAIIDRVIQAAAGLTSQYLAAKQFIASKKDEFVKEIQEFNSAKSVKNKTFADMHDMASSMDRMFREREKGYGNLYEEYYKYVENNIVPLSTEYRKSVKEISKKVPTNIVRLFKENNKNIISLTEDLINHYKSFTPSGEDETGSISDRDLKFYQILDYKNKGVVAAIDESKKTLDLIDVELKDSVQNYRKVLGTILSSLRKAPTGAFTVKNKGDLNKKKEGTDILAQVLKNMKNNEQFTVNSFISMLRLFDDVGDYKGIVNVDNLVEIAYAKKARINIISKDIEKAIKPINSKMNAFINKDALMSIDTNLNTKVQDDVKNLVGGRSDYAYSEKSIQDFLLSEFSSKYKLSPKIVGDLNSALWYDPEYSPANANISGGGFDVYTKVPRSQMKSSDWNSLYIISDWKTMINQCLRSLKTCSSTESGVFNPAHSEYNPQVDYAQKREEAKKTQYISHPGRGTEKSEDISSLRGYGSIAVGSNELSLVFSKKTREYQKKQLLDSFVFLLEGFEKWAGGEKLFFPKQDMEKNKNETYLNMLSRYENYFRELRSAPDMSLEFILKNRDRLFGALEKLSNDVYLKKARSLNVEDLKELYKSAEIIDAADKYNPDNKLVFKHLYAPETLTEEEKNQSKDIISFMDMYLESQQKPVYKRDKKIPEAIMETLYVPNDPNISDDLALSDNLGWPGISVVLIAKDPKIREKYKIPGNANFMISKPINLGAGEIKKLPSEVQDKYRKMNQIFNK